MAEAKEAKEVEELQMFHEVTAPQMLHWVEYLPLVLQLDETKNHLHHYRHCHHCPCLWKEKLHQEELYQYQLVQVQEF